MLPFTPEHIENLKARFHEAIARPYKAIEASIDPDNTPGKKREHVFDFEDGLRLVISRDYEKEIEVIHISASYNDEQPILTLKDLQTLAAQNFKRINNMYELPNTSYVTQTGILHWFIRMPDLN